MALRWLLLGFRLLKGFTRQPKEFVSSVTFVEKPHLSLDPYKHKSHKYQFKVVKPDLVLEAIEV